MLKEEYSFNDISEFLFAKINLLICGFPKDEERSHFIPHQWLERKFDVLMLRSIENNRFFFNYIKKGTLQSGGDGDICNQLPRILKDLDVDKKNILLDLSSLDHVLIMFLTKKLITYTVPSMLFASYTRPVRYLAQNGDIGFSLCDHVQEFDSVPGFARRAGTHQTVCTFLGFEGARLKKVFESVRDIDKFIPIVAFPSGAPQWFNVTMWNCMDVLQSEGGDYALYKCFSESIFDAVNIMRNNINTDENVVLVPLGTRPHSLACAIFASQHRNTRIIFDNVIERNRRAEGVAYTSVYHLTSFLNT